jgi:hypothetical protein
MLTTLGESTSGKLSDFEYQSRRLCGCGPWRWCKGVGEIYMDKGRVGEESKGKEMDRCPLTVVALFSGQNVTANSSVKSCQDAKHIFPDRSS